MRHYRAGSHLALTGQPPTTQDLARHGAPAESWYAVWVPDYTVINHPARPDTLAASWRDDLPLRIRAVVPATRAARTATAGHRQSR